MQFHWSMLRAEHSLYLVRGIYKCPPEMLCDLRGSLRPFYMISSSLFVYSQCALSDCSREGTIKSMLCGNHCCYCYIPTIDEHGWFFEEIFGSLKNWENKKTWKKKKRDKYSKWVLILNWRFIYVRKWTFSWASAHCTYLSCVRVFCAPLCF